MALVTTVGGETSNSYVTVAEADRYFQGHYSLAKASAWAALTQPRKESALKRACQQIETLKMLDSEYTTGSLPIELVLSSGYDVSIHKLELNQRLQLPRNVDLDSAGVSYIPQEVKDAQCEQAVHLLTFDDAALLTVQQGIIAESVQAGPVQSYTKYAEGAVPTYISPMAVELLRPFLRISSRLRRS